MKTASQAVRSLGDLVDKLRQRLDGMASTCEDIQLQWEGLRRLGAQRDDHAAEYLKRVLAQLAGMSHFLERCQVQMQQLIADPFGDGQGR